MVFPELTDHIVEEEKSLVAKKIPDKLLWRIKKPRLRKPGLCHT